MRTALKIAPGLVGDDTTFASAGAWSDGSNVRFWRGLPQIIGGWERMTLQKVSGVCRAAMSWVDNSAARNFGFGTHTHLHILNGGLLADITPVEFVPGEINGTGGQGYGTGAYGIGEYGVPSNATYFPLTWSLAAWGENLLANPRGQGLFQWENDLQTKAMPVAEAPEQITCVVTTPNRQVLALGCNEVVSEAFNAACIRGCDISDLTSWAPSLSNNAFEVILEGGGRIVLGLNIGDYVLVWTSQGLHLGSNTGAPNQPWRFDPVPGAIGVIGAKAAVVVGSSAYYLGVDGQFYRYDLGGGVSPIVCPIRDDFIANLAASQWDKIQASYVSQFQEVWFDYPDKRDGLENSRYIAASLIDGAWFKGEMDRSARGNADQLPAAVTPDGVIFWHEKGVSANGGPIPAFIESADQYLSEDQVMRIRGVWPDLQGQRGAVSLSVATRFKPQGEECWRGPFAMSPSQDKVDFMATGRLIRLRLESCASPSQWRLGRPIFDLAPAGTR